MIEKPPIIFYKHTLNKRKCDKDFQEWCPENDKGPDGDCCRFDNGEVEEEASHTVIHEPSLAESGLWVN